MLVPIRVIFSLFILLLTLQGISGDPVTRIRIVAVISRHGDRTPRVTFPTDPHPVTDRSEWPDGVAQLTSRGRRRVTRLGQILKARYAQVLTNNSAIIVQSSSQNRCVETASILAQAMTGMPHVDVIVNDRMLKTVYPNCSLADLLFERLQLSSLVVEYERKNEQFLQMLSEKTGKLVNHIQDVHEIWDVLQAEQEHAMSLPSWASAPVMKQLEELSSLFFCVSASSLNLQKLFTSLLLSDIKLIFETERNSSSHTKSKLLIYITNDFKIQWLLWMMHSKYKTETPAYAASLILELHEDFGESKWFVRAYYLDIVNGRQEVLDTHICTNALLGHVPVFTEQDFDDKCRQENVPEIMSQESETQECFD